MFDLGYIKIRLINLVFRSFLLINNGVKFLILMEISKNNHGMYSFSDVFEIKDKPCNLSTAANVLYNFYIRSSSKTYRFHKAYEVLNFLLSW